MTVLLAILVGALGGLCIVGLTTWIPVHMAQQEAQWRAELHEYAERISQSMPEVPGYSLRPGRDLAVLGVALGIAVAVGGVAAQGWSAPSVLRMCFAWILVALALIDLRTHLLPDTLVLPALWFGLVLQTIPGFGTVGVEHAIWGAAVGYLLLWLPATLFNLIRGADAMGHGDFKLMAAIGAWAGVSCLLPVVLVASFAAALFHVLRGRGRHEEFAFGPWLAGVAVGYMMLIG